jgi:16S rRNA (uracil1498-N3)-methyltransferase
MSARFFTTDALSLGDYTLEGPEAHHLAAVRRFNTGDRVTLFNGDGSEYQAEVLSIHKKSVVLQISEVTSIARELKYPLVVASALPKADRADFLIEKLTELGVSHFIPLLTERSIVRPKQVIVEKLHRAVIEASKQCGRNTLMMVESPSNWQDLLERTDLPRIRMVLHQDSGANALTKPAEGTIVAIGPEGGFTPEEVEAARQAGWKTHSLGPRILRVETAALAAATLLSVENDSSVGEQTGKNNQ